jgi:hypothetical protein
LEHVIEAFIIIEDIAGIEKEARVISPALGALIYIDVGWNHRADLQNSDLA